MSDRTDSHVTAEMAHEHVVRAGFSEEYWDKFIIEKQIGHLMLSLIHVARGDERELVDIYNEQRVLTGDNPVVRELALTICPTAEDFINQFERPRPKGT